MEASLNHQLYQKNVERWSLFNPQAAAKLSSLDASALAFCETQNGELNLQVEKEGKIEYYHSPSGALKEAQEWFSRLNLKGIQVICVYGVGLGYAFEACKAWLSENPDRLLFFIEDDLCVIKRLLETSLGSEIVHHKQTWLFYMEADNTAILDIIAAHFILRHFRFSALPFYQTSKPAVTNEMRIWLNYGKIQLDALVSEFVSLDGGYFKNFYKNIFLLPQARFGNKLFNRFAGMPAIICGAGPSLAKNFDVLKTLKNKAVIFAGGTALNLLNSRGMQPHLAVGIDPNPSMFERILNNQAFQVPFFYRNRMFHDAIRLVHGDRLYVSGSMGYQIGQWFESHLDINETAIQEGHNVVNFSVALANQMGCNPIILVGVDLAYTEDKSYAFHLLPHAIQDPKKAFHSKSYTETLISKKDIFGNPVNTLEKWILESHWFTQFAVEHPKITMINSTEGGLGFLGVPNVALSDVAKDCLTQEYDFDSQVYGTIQAAPLPAEATSDNIFKATVELEESLHKCFEYCSTLSAYYKALEENEEMGVNPNETLKLLFQELAYLKILNPYDSAFLHYHNAAFFRARIEKDPPEKTAHLLNYRFLVLQQVIRSNLNLLNQARELYKVQISVSLDPPAHIEAPSYSVEEDEFQIDPDATTQQTYHNDNGELEAECYVKDGVLHGPSRYYNVDGQLLALANFKNGYKEGKAYRWYSSGALESIQNFHENQPHGRQEYYYENQVMRGLYSYSNGLLDGVNTLYYPNGKLKREMHYKQGKRDGQDTLWNEAGLMYIASEYVEDKPTGFARKWYSNGNLALEIDYQDPNNPVTRKWNKGGIPIAPEKFQGEDYFDQVTKETGILTEAFTKMLEGILSLTPLASKEQLQDLKEIEKTIVYMQTLYKELQKESGNIVHLTKEAIWKTQAHELQMKEYLSVVTKKMYEDIMKIQKTIAEMTKQLKQAAESDTSKENEK